MRRDLALLALSPLLAVYVRSFYHGRATAFDPDEIC